jgi:hypothetical protein
MWSFTATRVPERKHLQRIAGDTVIDAVTGGSGGDLRPRGVGDFDSQRDGHP